MMKESAGVRAVTVVFRVNPQMEVSVLLQIQENRYTNYEQQFFAGLNFHGHITEFFSFYYSCFVKRSFERIKYVPFYRL